MNLNADYLKKIYSNDTDFIIREIQNGKNSIYIVFFESLIDSTNTYNFIIKPVENQILFHKRIKDIKTILSGPKLSSLKCIDDIFYYLESGFVGVLFKNEIFVLEIKSDIDRGITPSDTEPNMYGPKDAFCENYQKNLGIVKKRIKNKNLCVESVDRGIYTKNKISLLYMTNIVNDKELIKVKEILNKYKENEVIDSHDLVNELKTKSFFPTILKTEKAATAARYILNGYIVILMDNSPFALILDAKFKDFVNPYTTDKFVKVLRYICLLLNVLTPAIYLALINYNQETIPASLLINFTRQRAGVPFPAIVEAAMMLFICEILRESDIRFPSSYGSSASILGALILGEAAVNAGVVSPIMIIIVAISFITGLIFTEIELVGVLRVLRFAFLFVASFLGLYGLSIAIVICLAILSNVKMIEGNYL